MPAWSTEVGREIVGIAQDEHLDLDQLQLQSLIYIAHGWCLAFTDEPLTGDRPEAREHGAEYAMLTEALAPIGLDPVTPDAFDRGDNPLDGFEMDLIQLVVRRYGRLAAAQLAVLTQGPDTPWSSIYAEGAGEGRDISHRLIRDQFRELEKAAASSGDAQ